MIGLAGVALVQGRATGAAVIVRPRASEPPRHSGASAREEIASARRAASADIRHRIVAMPDGPVREILGAHAALIDDPVLTTEIDRHLDAGRSAEQALAEAASALVTRFEALGNPLFRGRARDLQDVCEYIARHLAGAPLPVLYPDSRVVCAFDLSAAEVLHLADTRPVAFVLERGAEASHAAILMRALGVPAVIGVPDATTIVRDGDDVLVDGDRGHVIVHPEPVHISQGSVAAGGGSTDRDVARTSDGVVIAVTATIAGAADLRRAIAAGADGVGLFRTEWLFLRGDTLPSEDEQAAIYREVAALAGPRPVTVRAVDLGGDKQPSALRLGAEPNPALGLRGVRLAFAHPDLLRTQLRALCRGFAGRRFRLLLPMVNDPGDVARVRDLVRDSAGPATREAFELGAMIETPAAALMASEIAEVVDFFSIGTNDLTQYVLAADREGPADAYQPLHPAVLRLVRSTTAAALRYGRPVGVCGEVAGDPRAAAVLIGLGVTDLSVAPEAIVRTKRLVRSLSAASVRTLAEQLLALPTAAAVAARLQDVERLERDRPCTPGA